MILSIVKDYKANIPLDMLSNKYKLPIWQIIDILHKMTVEYPKEIREAKKILKEMEK